MPPRQAHLSGAAKQAQQTGQDDFARLRASLAVARRQHRYYEPVPVVELDALLAAASPALAPLDGNG